MKNILRRSFIWKIGAGVSGALASTAAFGIGKAEASATGNPALRAALLEEEKALNKFHQAFEQAMDKGLHEEVIGMFSDDAEVVFNGGARGVNLGTTGAIGRHIGKFEITELYGPKRRNA